MTDIILRPNTYWKTRDGEKAFVFDKSPFHELWVGVIDSGSYTWQKNGRWSIQYANEIDLIEEWHEPVSNTVELVQCFDGTRHYCHIAGPCGYKITARKTTTITEGEGMATERSDI